jgi:hypothetical protein
MEKRQQELVDVLMKSSSQPALIGYICRVNVLNDVPAQYKVSIIGIGTDFDYTDGTTYRDIDDPINIGYGGIARTESNDSSKCVKTVFVAIKVQQQGFPPTALVTREDAPAGSCLIEVPLVIGLQHEISESQLNVNLSDLLKIKKIEF